MNFSRVEQPANVAQRGYRLDPKPQSVGGQSVVWMNLSRVVTKFLRSSFTRIMSGHVSGRALEAEASGWEGKGVS